MRPPARPARAGSLAPLVIAVLADAVLVVFAAALRAAWDRLWRREWVDWERLVSLLYFIAHGFLSICASCAGCCESYDMGCLKYDGFFFGVSLGWESEGGAVAGVCCGGFS